MADITLTFGDDKIGEIRRAYCAAYGWRSQELDGPRPAFMRAKLREHVRSIVRGMQEAEAVPPPAGVEDIVGIDIYAPNEPVRPNPQPDL